MEKQEKLASTIAQKPAAGSVVWPLIAILGIVTASWTVKTTFKQEPEQYRYFSFSSGDYHRIVRVDTKTDELKMVYPKPQRP